jgi:SAM-dependent methyltransferase
MRQSARVQAAKQWNSRACGEVDGDKESREYFARVEENRYRTQEWQKTYFPYGDFKGKRVLEIGVGQGTDLLQFARAGASCFGVDITDNHLALAARNFAVNGFEVDLRKADATALPFPDLSLDCVYSFGVIHHIPEADAVINDVYRVLKPGGQLLLGVYHKWSAFHVFTKILYDGLLRGSLFSKGYAGLLSTIEEGADGIGIKPFVDLYTTRDMRRLLTRFTVLDVSIRQLYADHFSPLFRWLTPVGLCRVLDDRLGWYVVARAVKTDD